MGDWIDRYGLPQTRALLDEIPLMSRGTIAHRLTQTTRTILRARWAWIILAGVGGSFLGLAIGLLWRPEIDQGIATLVGSAIGSALTVGAAFILVHYQLRANERRHESFALDVVQELHDDAKVLNAIGSLYVDNRHDALIPKAEAQAQVLMESIAVWERDISRSGLGSFEFRRAVLRLQKTVTGAKQGIKRGLERGESMMSDLQSAGALLEEQTERFGRTSRALRELTDDDVFMRMWSIDHE
jgi:hypothetical protein